MTPHLTKACACGRTISVECPNVADIPGAAAQMAGWGHDERGFVRCPDCLATPPAEPECAAVQQPDLFEKDAA